MVQKLILVSRKAMEQKQVTETRVTQIKKIPKKKNSNLSDQYKYDDYDTNESQDS